MRLRMNKSMSATLALAATAGGSFAISVAGFARRIDEPAPANCPSLHNG